jgi:hypothetical protein
VDPRKSNGLILEQLETRTKNSRKIRFETRKKLKSRTMSAALYSIVRLMPFNSKVEQIESRTASWNGLCSTFEGPLYVVM